MAERRKITFPKKKEAETMSLRQFLQNPTGKYSSQFARRDMVKANLLERYTRTMKKNGNKLNWHVYKVDETYLFHFKMPSEEFGDEILYDVVLQFLPTDEARGDLTINNYDMRFFSNSPGFTFTYAYVMYNSDRMVDLLAFKFDDRALKDEPKVRNPIESFGFEKSCYFAAMYMGQQGIHKKTEIENILSKWDDRIIDSIKTDKGKLMELNRVKAKKKEEKEKERKKKSENKNDKAKKQIQERREAKGFVKKKESTVKVKHTTRKKK
jgi:hypothetical protein